MQYYKVFEFNMWRVHAFDDGVDAAAYLPADAVRIADEEAKEIAARPPSEEWNTAMNKGIAALGGRDMARYPPKEVKEAIGAICVNSSNTEVVIRTIIWHVAGIDAETGMALTGGKLAINELTEMLTALLKHRHPSLHEKAIPLLKKLRSLNDGRGKFVHGIWSPGPDGGMSVGKPFLKRSHEQGKMEKVTLDQIYDIAEGYMKLESKLHLEILLPLIPER